MTKPLFYEAGKTYKSSRFPNHPWRFVCVALSPNPATGELTALGWSYVAKDDEWVSCGYEQIDWDLDIEVEV